MEETIEDATGAMIMRDIVKAYLSARTDLGETTVDGYRQVAQSQIIEQYGDLPADSLATVVDDLRGRQGEGPLQKKAYKLMRNIAGWRDRGASAEEFAPDAVVERVGELRQKLGAD